MGALGLLAAAVLLLGAPDTDKTVKGHHAEAACPAELVPYAAAMVKLLDADWEAYRDLYGLRLPEPIHLSVRLVPGGEGVRPQLWTDGERGIYLTTPSKSTLLPPERSGVFNAYGMGHELGHIVFYWRMSRTAGFPEGVAEGWAHYFGSVMATHAYGKLGPSVWPEPHDYGRSSGLPRLERQLAESRRTGKWDPVVRAAGVLRDVEAKYGAKALGRAIDQVLQTRPTGRAFVPRLADALASVTGDAGARALFPGEYLRPPVTVTAREADITRKELYAGLRADYRAGELCLSYGKGERTGQRSLGGDGQVVIFRKPEGRWKVVAVELYAARYGPAAAPGQTLSASLCDEGFAELREGSAAYGRWPRANEWRWERVELPPTEAPDYFCVALDLGSTGSSGLYLGTQNGQPFTHSRVGLPGVGLADMQGGGDWMVRCRLVPLDPGKAAEQVRWLQEEVAALRPAAR